MRPHRTKLERSSFSPRFSASLQGRPVRRRRRFPTTSSSRSSDRWATSTTSARPGRDPARL